jgi:Uri superfamily endonuclease
MIGRVYRLKCGDKFYIGSTVCALNRRLTNHKIDAKRKPRKCHNYFNEQGWDNVTIELLEEGEFENRKALCKREGEYILPYINDENCLNCNIAGRTDADYNKAYQQTNRDKINAQRRAKREAERWTYKFLD